MFCHALNAQGHLLIAQYAPPNMIKLSEEIVVAHREDTGVAINVEVNLKAFK